jgi:environmental stress-induced protein Ves
MRDILPLGTADARRQPWRNGRGFTEELALWPDAARFDRGDFDWRISRSIVREPGAFSAFPGFDRILVITRGEALILVHGESAPRARLRRHEPYRFAGDWTTSAELPAGEIADFNVLVRRGAAQADVEVLQLGRRHAREPIARGHAFAHVAAGAARVRVTDEEEAFELDAGESLWARGARDGEELDLLGTTDDAVVILVRVRGGNDRETARGAVDRGRRWR